MRPHTGSISSRTYGACLAAKDVGREKEMKFLGVDGLPNEGVTWVHNGELTATFLYPTPGAEGLRQAIKLLNGEKIEKVDHPADHGDHQGQCRSDHEG
jgi:ABC-type sugar transport system substrate-binding protein